MTVRLSTGLRADMLNTTGLKGAFANGVIYIYSGPQPLTADSAATGTLLGIVTKDAGAFTDGVATNGLNFDATLTGTISKAAAENWKFNGIAAGTAGWGRFRGNAADAMGASTTLPRLDFSIAAAGADVNLSNISIAVGAPNTVDVFTVTLPDQ